MKEEIAESKVVKIKNNPSKTICFLMGRFSRKIFLYD
tara:strand:+ start:151 stop:261 length:111 start_codon:yes stop_codon:yes gene_type:complete